MPDYSPTEFQQKIINTDGIDIALLGGRGGGKSYGVCHRVARLVKLYGQEYQGLYLRKTFPGVRDFEKITRRLFPVLIKGSKFNSTYKIWAFPNGATFELNQLEHPSDYDKYQGRSFTDLYVDECGQYDSPELLDLMLSNLRGADGIPLTRTLIANPGGRGHGWLQERYLADRQVEETYHEEESDRQVVTLVSTYLDNPKIDQVKYEKSLDSATANDPELRKAYKKGDWNIARGAFFGSVLSKERSLVPVFTEIPRGWQPFLACDYGTAAPCAIGLFLESPGGLHKSKFLPRGSIVQIDELYLSQRDLSKGIDLTIPQLADEIKRFLKPWDVSPMASQHVADDACFAEDGRPSIATNLLNAGVRFQPAQKGDRLTGWENLRTLMRQAGMKDDKQPSEPGFYVAENCTKFWRIMPTVPRSDRLAWDVDTKANDHYADMLRYACLRTKWGLKRDSGIVVY